MWCLDRDNLNKLEGKPFFFYKGKIKEYLSSEINHVRQQKKKEDKRRK